MNRIYLDYVQDILDSIRDIESFIKGMKFEEFKLEKIWFQAVLSDDSFNSIPACLRIDFKVPLGRSLL